MPLGMNAVRPSDVSEGYVDQSGKRRRVSIIQTLDSDVGNGVGEASERRPGWGLLESCDAGPFPALGSLHPIPDPSSNGRNNPIDAVVCVDRSRTTTQTISPPSLGLPKASSAYDTDADGMRSASRIRKEQAGDNCASETDARWPTPSVGGLDSQARRGSGLYMPRLNFPNTARLLEGLGSRAKRALRLLLLNFPDPEDEENFRSSYWLKAWPVYLFFAFGMSVLSIARFFLAAMCQRRGQEFCEEVVGQFFEIKYDEIDAQRAQAMAEVIFGCVSGFLILGPGPTRNMFALIVRLLPACCCPLWLRDRERNLKVSGIGEFWLMWSAVIMGLIGFANLVWFPFSQLAIPSKLLWTLTLYPIMMRMRFRHTAVLYGITLVILILGRSRDRMSVERHGDDYDLELARINMQADYPAGLFLSWTVLGISLRIIFKGEVALRESFIRQKSQGLVKDLCVNILAGMLPRRCITQLMEKAEITGQVQASAELYPNTSILFIRVNVLESGLNGRALVAELNRVFSILDALLARHSHVYKVETVGGEYMASAGVPKECPSSACAITAFAVEAMSKLRETSWASGVTVGARIGIHSGAVVAGIAGCKSPRYRLFGDVVNTASRMKDQASENQIMVSEAHVDKIKTCCGKEDREDGIVDCIAGLVELRRCGEKEIKGKGRMHVWSVQMRLGQDLPQTPLGVECNSVAAQSNGKTRGTPTDESVSRCGSEMSMAGVIGSWSILRKDPESRMHLDEMIFPVDELVEDIPVGSKLEIGNFTHFFEFKDRQVEAAFWRQSFAREFSPSTNRSKMIADAVIYAVTVVAVLHSYAVCDIPKDQFRHLWDVVGITVGTSLGLATVSLVFMLWARRVLSKNVKGYVGRGAPTLRNWLRNEMARGGKFKLTFFLSEIIFCASISVAILVPMAIFGETLGEVRNPRLFWYIVRRNTANHSALLYACVQYSHLRFCSRILYTWVFATGLMLSSTGAIGEEILFLCFVLYSCTLLVTSRRHELASIVRTTRSKFFLEQVVQDLLPQHVLRAVVSQQDVPCDLLNCGHLFADLKGYTAIASKLQPDDAFLLVSKIFDEFDKLCDKWGVTKIETIGDAYWAAIGVETGATTDDMWKIVGMALDMQSAISKIKVTSNADLEGCTLGIRIGVHYGSCLGGVVGQKMPRYHLFGSNIEVVQVLEKSGSVDGVHLSGAAARLLGISRNAGDADDQELPLPRPNATNDDSDSGRDDRETVLSDATGGRERGLSVQSYSASVEYVNQVQELVGTVRLGSSSSRQGTLGDVFPSYMLRLSPGLSQPVQISSP